jgi:hypothetical protein
MSIDISELLNNIAMRRQSTRNGHWWQCHRRSRSVRVYLLCFSYSNYSSNYNNNSPLDVASGTKVVIKGNYLQEKKAKLVTFSG